MPFRERKEAFGDHQSETLTHRGGYHALLSGALGESLVTDDDAKYVSTVRGLFGPLLNKRAVEKYMGTIYTVIQRHMDDWETKSKKDETDSRTGGVEIYTSLKAMYADVLFEVFIGANAKGVDRKQVLKDCARVFTGATSFPVSGGSFFSSKYDKGLKSGKRLRKIYREQLLLHMADIRESGEIRSSSKHDKPVLLREAAKEVLRIAGNSNKPDPCSTSRGPHKSLLDAAADHLALFSTGLTSKLLASLSVSFLRILNNPRQQSLLQLIRKEVKSEESGAISYLKLSRLRELEKVCLEIQRVYPPLAGLARGAEKADVRLAGYKIPKGWMIWSCNYTANRDPSVFVDASKFDTKRWDKHIEAANSTSDKDEKDTTKDTQHLHLAFGFGKRSCLGFHFSMCLWKVFCFTASTRYSWTLQRQSQGTTTKDGDDSWQVKWIPVYSPSPDVVACFATIS